MQDLITLSDLEIDQVDGGKSTDSYWGGMGKIALGIGGIGLAVATGGTIVVIAGVVAGAAAIYEGANEAHGALETAGK